MVESSESFFHPSPAIILVSKMLMMMAVHDFDGRVLFSPDFLTDSACNRGRLNSVLASNQAERRDMLENKRLNLVALWKLGEAR